MLQSTESAVQKSVPGMPSAGPAAGLGPAMEQATLGATVVVKGEVSGAQALYVDGRVEGSIHFPNHRVTIGRTAVVLANIEARELIIMGTVTGNIECGDRVEIRAEAVFNGDVVTQRISIDGGAMVKGSVDIRRRGERIATNEAQGKTDGTSQPQGGSKPDGPSSSQAALKQAGPAEVPRAGAAAAAAGSQGAPQRSVARVAGSSVLYEEPKAGPR